MVTEWSQCTQPAPFTRPRNKRCLVQACKRSPSGSDLQPRTNLGNIVHCKNASADSTHAIAQSRSPLGVYLFMAIRDSYEVPKVVEQRLMATTTLSKPGQMVHFWSIHGMAAHTRPLGPGVLPPCLSCMPSALSILWGVPAACNSRVVTKRRVPGLTHRPPPKQDLARAHSSLLTPPGGGESAS